MTGSSEVEELSKSRSRNIIIHSIIVVSHSAEPRATDLLLVQSRREGGAVRVDVITRCVRHGDGCFSG